jgi:TolB-like protein
MIIGGMVYSQKNMSLDSAIQTASKRIENELPSDTNVAILNFISSSEELSNYVIDEIMDTFANGKKLNVVERSRIETIQNERGYQFSGEVVDYEIIFIGKQFGAEYVITGSITFSGTSYRFRVYAINQ